MAITNFLSTVWSENLLTALDAKYIGVANCNRDYEGEIKEKGSLVKICGVGSITVSDYSKGVDILTQSLSDTSVDLYINYAKYFNFQVDDIDRAQSSPKLMDAALKVAADALAREADKNVYALASEASIQINSEEPTEEDVLDYIIKARQRLYNNHVSDSEEVVLEVSPAVAALILKAKVKLANTDDTLENGCIGKLFGCKVFVTNNIDAVPDGEFVTYKCMMRTKRAIAFAEQISDIHAYRPEKRFADAVKGLHLYGTSIVYPKEIVALNFTIRS